MPAPAPPDPVLVERYVQIFAIVSSLLGAFLLAVLLFMFARRRRAGEADRRSADSAALPDAWSEAGRRAEPFDAPGAEARVVSRKPASRPRQTVAAGSARSEPGGPPLAIVTGAGRRVGRAVAVELAREGFDLMLTWRHRDDASRGAIDETVTAAHAAAKAAKRSIDVGLDEVDLDDAAQVDDACRRIALLPRVDAIVHNASSYAATTFGTIADADLMHHFRVNAVAPLLLTQAAARPLRRSKLKHGGAVVCFSDIHVLGRPRRNFAAYAMSKAALTQMVELLARELAPSVRVNAIAPGVVAWPDDTPAEERHAYEERIPLGRPGTPEEAAALVRWLVLEAGYITGEVIRLDGGRWLR